MNQKQTRLLLETEFHFYRLQVGDSEFQSVLKTLGYKPSPNLQLVDDSKLNALNQKIRKILRQPPPLK